VCKSALRAEFAVAHWPEPAELSLVEVASSSQLILCVSIVTPDLVTYSKLDEGLAQLRASKVRQGLYLDCAVGEVALSALSACSIDHVLAHLRV
jgi:hypothetical protein